MSEQIVIIHGWSDDSSTFTNLANFISAELKTKIIRIDLGDWISMNDDVSFYDIAEGMNRAWIAQKLPTNKRTANLIVHSTGALVVREWMTRYFTAESVPIKRLLMLAPANFGSQLAHKGRSFLGRALKGWGNDGFETGELILRGLELASPYTWELADLDVFSDEAWYGPKRILATVLVGNEGYDGVRSIANEIGSDGTVRISTANLNSMKIRMELDENQSPTNASIKFSNGNIGFGIIDKINHSTITLSESRKHKSQNILAQLIIRSLQVEDLDYGENNTNFPWQAEIDKLVGNTKHNSDRMQNMVVKATDNLGNKVDDFFVEFYRTEKKDEAFEHNLYSKFINSAHSYSLDNSYRSIYLNITELENLKSMDEMSISQLFISISAKPVYKEDKAKQQPVGYVPVEPRRQGGLRLSKKQIDLFFRPHLTIFIEIVLTRKLSSKVFTLTQVK